MPIPGSTGRSSRPINVGRSIGDDVRAVYISDDPRGGARLRATSSGQIPGVPLVVVESPYRALAGPLLAYLDVLDAAWPPDKPGTDHVRRHPRVRRPPLVGADPLQPGRRSACGRVLLGRPHTVVVNVPYRREDPALFEAAPGTASCADGEARDRADRSGSAPHVPPSTLGAAGPTLHGPVVS